jgi:phosphopantetheinyl transferase (holo-ACP synthase)
MTVRCGIDRVEMARMERLLAETPLEQLLGIFSLEELQEPGEGMARAADLAARFAAKEACLKLFPRETALGEIGPRDFVLTRDAARRHRIACTAKGQTLLDRHQLQPITVSLSHGGGSASAVACTRSNDIDVPLSGKLLYHLLAIRRREPGDSTSSGLKRHCRSSSVMIRTKPSDVTPALTTRPWNGWCCSIRSSGSGYTAAGKMTAERRAIASVEAAHLNVLLARSEVKSMFRPEELQDAGDGAGRAARLAARLAAKQACLKLFPREAATNAVGAVDFTVRRDGYGAPQLVCNAKVRRLLDQYRLEGIALSLTHDGKAGSAVAIVEPARVHVPLVGKILYYLLPFRRRVMPENLRRVSLRG